MAMVSCGARVSCGDQLRLQRPSLSDTNGSGGSPFEKEATTDPVTIGLPQSSTTRVSTVSGHLAGTLKFAPREVTRGSSWVVAHPVPAAADFSDAGAKPKPDTMSRLTVCALPSVN